LDLVLSGETEHPVRHRRVGRLRVVKRSGYAGRDIALSQCYPGGWPKISWYGLTEPHASVLHCGGHNRIALLVLPPDKPEEVALTAMLMAAAPE
jgi:hypothetical protein